MILRVKKLCARAPPAATRLTVHRVSSVILLQLQTGLMFPTSQQIYAFDPKIIKNKKNTIMNHCLKTILPQSRHIIQTLEMSSKLGLSDLTLVKNG